MPGPGGGSNGGGGHRGGFHNQGPRGMHGGPYRGRWYHRPYYGGGCFGSFLGIVLWPLVLIIILFTIFSSAFTGAFYEFKNGGNIRYDKNKIQDYADAQYKNEFGSFASYEDNILLVFLTEDDEYYDYYYIAWVGDHINTNINYMFGNENTELGKAISNSINSDSYKYSLDSNLAQVIQTMKNKIVSLGLDSSFTCEEEHNQVQSHLTNKTSIDLNSETINDALQNFTDETGITMRVVVDDITNVFPKKVSITSIIMLIIAICIVILVVYSIYKNNKRKDDNTYINNQKRKTNDYQEAYWEEKK